MKEKRFFVDDRCGCVAVRDREKYDPEEPHLDSDVIDVVWFRMKKLIPQRCDKCYQSIQGKWDDEDSVDEAIRECEKLNSEPQP